VGDSDTSCDGGGTGDVSDADRHVDRVGDEVLTLVTQHEVDSQIWVLREKRVEARDDLPKREGQGSRDAQDAPEASGTPGEVVRLVQRGEDRLHAREILGSRVRQVDRSRRPRQQGRADLPFELGDEPRRGRLRQAQLAARGREAPGARDPDEQAKREQTVTHPSQQPKTELRRLRERCAKAGTLRAARIASSCIETRR
jgi:hypothetical protein